MLPLSGFYLVEGKWSPKNGFGFELVFQKSKFENEQTEFSVESK